VILIYNKNSKKIVDNIHYNNANNVFFNIFNAHNRMTIPKYCDLWDPYNTIFILVNAVANKENFQTTYLSFYAYPTNKYPAKRQTAQYRPIIRRQLFAVFLR